MPFADILIHVNEVLAQSQQSLLESTLREITGVVAPRFNKPHLLLIFYNAKQTNAIQLLNAVRNEGYQAKLVGL